MLANMLLWRGETKQWHVCERKTLFGQPNASYISYSFVLTISIAIIITITITITIVITELSKQRFFSISFATEGRKS